MPDNTLAAWLFTCLGGAGASLREIIAYVDYRNHAILTYEELTDALEQLRQRVIVERAGDRLRVGNKDSYGGENPLFSREEFIAAVNEYSSTTQ